MQACRGDLSDAEATLKRARQLIAGRGHPLLAFQVLRTQAWAAYLRGTYHRAMGLNRLAEQEAGHNVSPEVVASFRNPVPAILREWGEGEIAWEAAHRRLEAARQIQDRLALSHAYTDLGNLYLDRGQFAEAERAFHQAIAEAKAIGEDGFHRLHGEIHLVYAHSLQGHAMEAVEVAEAALLRSQARNAAPLESALARTAVALARICPPSQTGEDERETLLEMYRAFDQMGIRYGMFVSATLIGLTCLADGLENHQQQTRHYVTRALTLAAAEGYIQTIVTSRRALLPLMLFALREGVEPRFTGQTLAQMGPEALAGVVEASRNDDARVRGRATFALEMIGAHEESRETALAALERLTQDPDPDVRAAAYQAQSAIGN